MGLVLERGCSLLRHCGESGAQVTFSSTLPVEGNNIRRNRWAESIHTLLHGWCHCQHFGLCSTRHAGIRWDSSFSAREESLCSGSSRAHWQSFTLDGMGEADSTRLVPGKLGWDAKVRGTRCWQRSSAALSCAGHTGAPCSLMEMTQGLIW